MSSHTLKSLHERVGGELHGDASTQITGVAIIRDATPGDITLAGDAKFSESLKDCDASAVIVAKGVSSHGLPCIEVEDLHAAFMIITQLFRPAPRVPARTISPAAHVSDTAQTGENPSIAANVVVEDGVVLGDNVTLHAGVVVMEGSVIGNDTTIFPNAVIYENSKIGDRCIIHASAVIGAYGFGYDSSAAGHVLSAQLGNVEIGNDVEVGACVTIDRGTYTPTTIGDGSKLDNQVQIAHNCRIGRHNMICSQVGIAGSCTTGDFVVLAGQVGIGDHITINDGGVCGAQAGIMQDVPAGTTVIGSPARPARQQFGIFGAMAKLPAMRRELRALSRDVAALQTTDATEKTSDDAPAERDAA